MKLKIKHSTKKRLIMATIAMLPSFCLFLIFGWSHAPASDGSYPALRDRIDPKFQADSGVITEKDREYILVARVEHKEGGKRLVELVKTVEEMMDRLEDQ